MLASGHASADVAGIAEDADGSIELGQAELTSPLGVHKLHPSSDAGLRSQFAYKAAAVPLLDVARREVETETDQ